MSQIKTINNAIKQTRIFNYFQALGLSIPTINLKSDEDRFYDTLTKSQI